MKIAITILCSILLTTAYGQKVEYKVYLDSAKTLFKSSENLSQDELDSFDYNQIVVLLQKAIELNPKSTEARYFLGYAYSRLNAHDGRGMIAMNIDLVYKSSEQFEKIIQLTPKYSGEIFILDPYSKITAEWGSMAMSYWHNNKVDSAKWAFKEGKKRGGFGNFILELNKQVLDACSKNSMLISSGDNFSIPLWYLQIAENYRTDITVVDISLLNTSWYPALLSQRKSVSFELPNATLDTIQYMKWADSTITINDFSWTVQPSYYQYLLRGDRVFLSLLQHNKFQREMYFTIGFMEESRLSLKNYLTPLVIVDKLTVSDKKLQSYEDYKTSMQKALQLSKFLNLNSKDQISMFDNFRYNLLWKAEDYLEINEKNKAKELITLLDKIVNEKNIPIQDKKGKLYAEKIRRRL
ncbi:MAG: tetratricopeptide repeat protein [Ferruginibacter sp.]